MLITDQDRLHNMLLPMEGVVEDIFQDDSISASIDTLAIPNTDEDTPANVAKRMEEESETFLAA